MIDTSALAAEVTRYTSLEAGVEAAFAAQAQAINDAVAAAIAKTMADDNATAEQVQAAAQQAFNDAVAPFKADNDKLSAALIANTPVAPTQAVPTPPAQ